MPTKSRKKTSAQPVKCAGHERCNEQEDHNGAQVGKVPKSWLRQGIIAGFFPRLPVLVENERRSKPRGHGNLSTMERGPVHSRLHEKNELSRTTWINISILSAPRCLRCLRKEFRSKYAERRPPDWNYTYHGCIMQDTGRSSDISGSRCYRSISSPAGAYFYVHATLCRSSASLTHTYADS